MNASKILFFRTNRMSGRLNVSEGVACGRPVQRTPCIYYPQKYETPIHVKSTKIVIFVSDTLHFYKSLSGFENFWPRPGNHRYRKFFSGWYSVPIGSQNFLSGQFPVPIGTNIGTQDFWILMGTDPCYWVWFFQHWLVRQLGCLVATDETWVRDDNAHILRIKYRFRWKWANKKW